MASNNAHAMGEKFEPNCPYYASDPLTQIHQPIFRLTEQFSDGSEYVGDSLGGQSFIDRSPLSANRPCSDHCACGQLHHGAEKDDFTFTVRKTDSTIGIGLHSFALSSYIGRRLGLTSNKIDGFFLLKHITSLETQLQELRNDIQSHPPSGSWTDLIHEQDTQLEAELRLLVEGLLSDHQVFDSFGYENLYNKGILTHDRWKTFQGCKTAMAIDGLDSAFHAVDQAEADDDLETAVRSGLARSPMTRRDVPSTSSVQDNVLNFGSIDYAADRHAHWCLSMAADTSFCYCELLRKQNSSAKSAMFAAVAAGNLSHVDILLKASRQKHILYDVNDTSDGLTPLMVAVESGFVKIAQLLVNNGAFPNQSTKRGNAISAARERGFEDFTQFLLGAARVCPRQHKRHTRRSSCFSALDRYFRTPTTVLEPQRRSQSSGTDMRHKASISGIKLRYLHREFRRQHEQISAIAHASVRRVETQCREDTLRNFITAHLMVEPRGLFRIEWPLHTKYVATEEGQDGLRHPNPLEDKSGKSLDCNSTGSKQNRTKDDDHVYEPGLDDETATGIPKEQYAPRLGHVRSGREIEGHFVIDTDSKAWGHGFEHDYLKAWDRGIYVMRGLCRGEPPSSLRDTILFLEVARAMCLSKTNSDRSDFNLEFAADLGRWQVLFDSKESLSTFQTAVRDIWGISAEELSRVQTPDARSLEFFHELATSLVSSVEVSLDLQIERARGLLLSQQQWHANKQSAALEEPGGAPSLLQVPNAYGERREILVHELEDPATPYRRDRSHNYQPCIPPEDASYGDSEIRISSPIVLLLIPSFAFVMVIAFLLALQCGFLKPTWLTSAFSGIGSPTTTQAGLRDAVLHLCFIMKSRFSTIHDDLIERVKNTMSHAVQVGAIEKFSDMAKWIEDDKAAQDDLSIGRRVRTSGSTCLEPARFGNHHMLFKSGIKCCKCTWEGGIPCRSYPKKCIRRHQRKRLGFIQSETRL